MRRAAWIGCLLLACGCGGRDDAGDTTMADASWSVTAWGERFEIFAECDPLAAERPAHAYTHVTHLAEFSPLRSGAVTVLLRPDQGESVAFRQEGPARDGIFRIVMMPEESGIFAISFLVETEEGAEEIAAGTVRVGAPGSPGSLTGLAPGVAGEAPGIGSDEDHEVISFLKEQQWRTAFATDWSREGSLRLSVKGPGRVRPAAGAEAILSAPLDGIVATEPWPHVGLEVNRDAALLRLAPRAASNRTLPELAAETEAARARLARLETLLAKEAVSVSEVEAARARLASLEPQLGAAMGGRGARSMEVAAPFAGQVAEVYLTAGQAVSAGDPLVRIVRTHPVWVEMMLTPNDAARSAQGIDGLILKATGSPPLRIEGAQLRLVAQSPEVDLAAGTVATIFEARDPIALRPGTALEAEALLPEEIAGVVVPASALVDDGGVPIVYLQIHGEAFLRHEVAVRARQGDAAMVEGLPAGLRIVTRGGAAIRREALLKTGTIEGHVH